MGRWITSSYLRGIHADVERLWREGEPTLNVKPSKSSISGESRKIQDLKAKSPITLKARDTVWLHREVILIGQPSIQSDQFAALVHHELFSICNIRIDMSQSYSGGLSIKSAILRQIPCWIYWLIENS